LNLQDALTPLVNQRRTSVHHVLSDLLKLGILGPHGGKSNLIERRRAKRAQVNLAAKWEGVLSQMSGTVTDISTGGCFVLTEDRVQLDELIRLEIQLLGGKLISIWGEIVYRAPDIGFGLRFTGCSEQEQIVIERLVDYAISESSLF